MRAPGQNGNVILFLLFAVFLLGGGAYFALRANTSDKAGRSARAAFDEAVSRLELAMSDAAGVEASLSRNSSTFACLYTANADCANQGGPFLLYQGGALGQPVSQMARDSGLTPEGKPCQGFPSENCPLHVETSWQPVCKQGNCENTRSLRVEGKITFRGPAGEAPLEWKREETYSPAIQLSQAASCERGGGVWANTECLTPAQASERQIASYAKGGALRRPTNEGAGERPEDSGASPLAAIPAAPQLPAAAHCPDRIVVQALSYPVQYLSEDRAQVNVPAMSCPTEGVYDVFVFQCAPKSQPDIAGEGQWVQVEAVMAPACDSSGNSLGESVRF